MDLPFKGDHLWNEFKRRRWLTPHPPERRRPPLFEEGVKPSSLKAGRKER